MSYLGGDYAGSSLITNAAAGAAAAGTPADGPGPDAKAIVDGYRDARGGLKTEDLAKAIYAQSGGDMDAAQAFKAALAGELGLLERAEVDRALGRQDGISVGEHATDGVVQFGKGVWGTVKGLGSLAWSTAKTGYDTNLTGLAFDKLEDATGTQMPDWLPSAERGVGRLEAGRDAVVGLGKAVWNDPSILLNEYKPLAADGRYGAIVGQLAADFGDLLIGAKGAGKAGQVARAAGGAADVAKVAKAADSASELARTVRAVPGGADDAAGALKATRAALDEIDTAGLPDDVARKVQTARADLVEFKSTGLDAMPSPRTPGLPDRIGANDLLAIKGIPGRQGVLLTDANLKVSEVTKLAWELSTSNGIEYGITKTNAGFVLRSGSPTSVSLPTRPLPVGHTHPPDAMGELQKLPSRTDINELNRLWARNPDGPRPTSSVIWGPGPDDVTPFGATGIVDLPAPNLNKRP